MNFLSSVSHTIIPIHGGSGDACGQRMFLSRAADSESQKKAETMRSDRLRGQEKLYGRENCKHQAKDPVFKKK